MERDHFFEPGRSAKNREADREESGEFRDANGFDDVGVFGSVDTRAGEAERETKSRRRLKLVHAAAKDFSVGLQENFAARSGDRIRKLRNLRMLERFKTANPNQRRNGFDLPATDRQLQNRPWAVKISGWRLRVRAIRAATPSWKSEVNLMGNRIAALESAAQPEFGRLECHGAVLLQVLRLIAETRQRIQRE